jgi:hypothetical protein
MHLGATYTGIYVRSDLSLRSRFQKLTKY